MANTIDPNNYNSASQEQRELNTSKPENQNSTVNSKIDNDLDSEKKSQENENNQSFDDSTSSKDFFQENDDFKESKSPSDELLQTRKATYIYVDNRSGGFYSEKEIKIEGDAVGRDQTKYTQFSSQSWHFEESVEYVLKKDIEKIQKVYIKPQKYKRLEKILNDHNILIIKGNSQIGKRATSINLLLTFEPQNILEIPPNINSINLFNYEENQYYLIDNPSIESVKEISGHNIKRLSRNFKERKSYLIIILDSYIEFPEELLDEYGVYLNPRDLSANSELLERHLSWYIKQDSISSFSFESINDLISNDQIVELLKNELFPRDLDRLAKSLAKVASLKLSLEDALENFSLTVSKRVKTWFEAQQNLKQRLFMITLAVLNGSSYQVVKEASRDLISLVNPPLDEENNRFEVVDEIFDSRSELIEQVKAHLERGLENAEYGSSSVELIVLNNSQYQPAVLSYIWHEYDNLRIPLLAWLLKLGKSPTRDIRIKVAAAIGYLSQQDFSLIRRQILLNWANCSDKNAQISAAIALTVPVWNGVLVSEILGLLHHWSTLENRGLHQTAIEAYGRGIGVKYPATALQDLFIIAHSCDIKLFWKVAEVVVSIFDAGQYTPSHYMIVLNALNIWAKKIDGQSVKSLVIFWKLMAESKVKIEDNGKKIPTLLFLSKVNKDYEIIILDLLSRLLNTKSENKDLQKRALTELHTWLKYADTDRQLFKTIGRIFFLLVKKGNNLEKGRICYFLEQWYYKDRLSSAKKILSTLKQSEYV